MKTDELTLSHTTEYAIAPSKWRNCRAQSIELLTTAKTIPGQMTQTKRRSFRSIFGRVTFEHDTVLAPEVKSSLYFTMRNEKYHGQWQYLRHRAKH